jgi:hypothetical protein
MNNETLIKEIAERAGLDPDMPASCDEAHRRLKAGALAPVGTIGMAVCRASNLVHPASGVTFRAQPGGETWVLARLGQRTAARRMVKLLKRLEKTQAHFPGAELAFLPGPDLFQVVGQGHSADELSAAISGQI